MVPSEGKDTDDTAAGKPRDPAKHFESGVIRSLLESGVAYMGSTDELRRTFGHSKLENASDEDLRRASELVTAVVTAMVSDSPDSWDAISAAWEAAEGLGGKEAKRRELVGMIETYARQRAQHGEGPTLENFRRSLEILDEQFANLDLRKAKELLDACETEDAVGPGGPHRGSRLTAARLSCMVGAFGDNDESKSVHSFRVVAPTKRAPSFSK